MATSHTAKRNANGRTLNAALLIGGVLLIVYLVGRGTDDGRSTPETAIIGPTSTETQRPPTTEALIPTEEPTPSPSPTPTMPATETAPPVPTPVPPSPSTPTPVLITLPTSAPLPPATVPPTLAPTSPPVVQVATSPTCARSVQVGAAPQHLPANTVISGDIVVNGVRLYDNDATTALIVILTAPADVVAPYGATATSCDAVQQADELAAVIEEAKIHEGFQRVDIVRAP